MHREPDECWHTFSGSTFHPLSEAPEQQLQLKPPEGAAPQASAASVGTTARHQCFGILRGSAARTLCGATPSLSLLLAPAPSTSAGTGPLQSMTTAAGLLVSKDSGATWKVVGDIEVRRWSLPSQAPLLQAAAQHCCTVLLARPLLSPNTSHCHTTAADLADPLLPTHATPRQDAKTWLVNPVLEQGSKGQLIMMFRTAAGGQAGRWVA